MKLDFNAKGRRMTKLASGILGMAAVAVLSSMSILAQNAPASTEEAAKQHPASVCPSTANSTSLESVRTFYLKDTAQQNEANEIQTAIRNILPPSTKLYLVPSQDTIIMCASPAEFAVAEKIIHDLDRPKKSFRLTYTITEADSGKRVGTQHFSMIVAEGQRMVLKEGSKVPIATGSYDSAHSASQTQATYLDVGMNFDATLDQVGDRARLKTKVEQSSVAEDKSGMGSQDPIIRQTYLEGTSFLTLGKPLLLGSLDIPGSTRHLDVEAVIEQVP
jgi:type II secretory pathway component GspD/PulD (secretin)